MAKHQTHTHQYEQLIDASELDDDIDLIDIQYVPCRDKRIADRYANVYLVRGTDGWYGHAEHFGSVGPFVTARLCYEDLCKTKARHYWYWNGTKLTRELCWF